MVRMVWNGEDEDEEESLLESSCMGIGMLLGMKGAWRHSEREDITERVVYVSV